MDFAATKPLRTAPYKTGTLIVILVAGYLVFGVCNLPQLLAYLYHTLHQPSLTPLQVTHSTSRIQIMNIFKNLYRHLKRQLNSFLNN
jgi:hypothetical protein